LNAYNPDQADTDADGIGDVCEAPLITSWHSVRTHGNGVGELAITLNAIASGTGISGPSVETRNGGVQKITIGFDRPVTLVNATAVSVTGRTTVGSTMQGPVDYSAAASASLLDANTLQILFDPGDLPDQTCYTINIAGAVQSTVGINLAGDTDCKIRSLVGDVNGNGTVNTTDMSLIKSKVSPPLDVTTGPQYDVNLSGIMNTTDMSLVKSRVTSPTKTALCP
jgi:hypothetical protein